MRQTNRCVTILLLSMSCLQASGCAWLRPHVALADDAATTHAEAAAVNDDDGSQAIEGMVVDMLDQPQADTRVRLNTVPPRTVTTDATGRFYFADITTDDGMWRVTAAKGTQRARVDVEQGTFKLVRLQPEATLRLSIRDAVSFGGIAHASVTLDSEDESPTDVFETDDAGVASIDSPPDLYFPVISAAGYLAQRAQLFYPIKRAVGQVLLTRGGRVSGRVVDAAGHGVQGASVFVQGTRSSGLDGPSSVETDNQGRWELEHVPKGYYVFDATHAEAGHGTTPPKRADGTHPLDHVDIQLRATPAEDDEANDAPFTKGSDEALDAQTDDAQSAIGACSDLRLEGQVVDAFGHPVAGADVYLRAGMFDPNARTPRRDADATTTADANGMYHFFDRPPGDVHVWALFAGICPREARAQDKVFVGKETDRARIVVPDGATVTGRVAFADGKIPVTFQLSPDMSCQVRAIAYGDDGTFTLKTFGPGQDAFDIVGPAFVPKTIPYDVLPEAHVDFSTLVVSRGYEARGRVVMPDGKPVAGAEVGSAKRAVPMEKTVMGLDPQLALTDTNGFFHVQGLDANQLRAYHPEWGVGLASVSTGNANVTITLQPASSICGQVIFTTNKATLLPVLMRSQDDTVFGGMYLRHASLFCVEDLPANTYCFEDASHLDAPASFALATPRLRPRLADSASNNALCVAVRAGDNAHLDLHFDGPKALEAAKP